MKYRLIANRPAPGDGERFAMFVSDLDVQRRHLDSLLGYLEMLREPKGSALASELLDGRADEVRLVGYLSDCLRADNERLTDLLAILMCYTKKAWPKQQ
jgi:hypothetical protein